jgi:hypothetical protein
MTSLPLRRLKALEQKHAREPRVHFLFVAPDATDAEIAVERDRLIADGTASPDDRFIPFSWKK